MSFTANSGFFPDYYLNLKNSIADFDVEIEKINECKNDLERVQFLENLKGLKEHDDELQICQEFEGKSSTAASEFKERGNLAFKSKKWLEAMVLYTKSYIALPEDKG